MDLDDVSLAHRLERQVEYIERYPQIGIVGSWIHNMDEKGLVKGTWCPPTNSKVLKWTNFFGVCFSHSTVLMRCEVMEKLGFYRPQAIHGEDVDLWLRASSITEFGNVPEVLNKYRVWNGSSHQLGLQLRRNVHLQLLASYIKNFVQVEPPMEAVAGLRQTRVGPTPNTLKQIHATSDLIKNLYDTFLKKNELSTEERREISWDVAKRMAFLALAAWRIDARASVPLLMEAIQTDYRLLSPSVIMKGFKRSLAPEIGR